ncbi:hypothetical protein OO006_13315 [Prosthecochloris sp. SCSIO W1101]|uniref:hypothetical protein n=1 Tax=Prosthecochloris sp. SCSIO W1101 TaxID=2992242 RepID=UPI00223DF512|nr:hypothetical protein [Prosthecochloris sp. SCSIO W1101]UZJ41302.1 hypothetical protein OO006_13315 [Prosthecochloris sp. SCSIO W1101]
MSFLMIVLAVIFTGCSGASEQKVESEQKSEAVTGENVSSVDYAFDKDSFAFSFTAYGAKDKSYVITGITFKDYTVDSPDNKLEGTTLEVKLGSVDSSFDKNNGKGGDWSDIILPTRDENIVKGFVDNLAEKETATAKVVGVDDTKIDLEVTLNGVTKVVEMPYTVTDGVLTAKGSTDVVEYNASDAFEEFANICSAAFHYGKSWSDIELIFSVNVQ